MQRNAEEFPHRDNQVQLKTGGNLLCGCNSVQTFPTKVLDIIHMHKLHTNEGWFCVCKRTLIYVSIFFIKGLPHNICHAQLFGYEFQAFLDHQKKWNMPQVHRLNIFYHYYLTLTSPGVTEPKLINRFSYATLFSFVNLLCGGVEPYTPHCQKRGLASVIFLHL